jgi:hypothetical protein
MIRLVGEEDNTTICFSLNNLVEQECFAGSFLPVMTATVGNVKNTS